jgi:hypothetical protein
VDRQKILRLVVKEILVGHDTVTIKHSIPASSSPRRNGMSALSGQTTIPSYLLCGRSAFAAPRQRGPWGY